eukprot:403337922
MQIVSQKFTLIQEITLDQLIEYVLTIPEEPKDSLKKKRVFAKTLTKFSQVQFYQQRLQGPFLNLLKIENLHQITDFDVQDEIMKATKSLYLNKTSISAKSDKPVTNQVGIENLQLIVMAMCYMMSHEETRIFQHALEVLLTLIKQIHETNPEILKESEEQLQKILVEGTQAQNTVVQVRYFELTCKLAMISPEISKIVEPIIDQVLGDFFSYDILTQMAVMDFVALLGQNKWTSMLLTKQQFLPKLFEKFKYGEDQYGFITNNLVTLSAFVYSDLDLKKASLNAMRMLLKVKDEESKEKFNEFIRRAFGNITTPQNFPEMGDENSSVNFLIKETDVPFEDLEFLGMKVIKQLLNWEWGARSLYANSQAVSYILKRVPKPKELMEKKFTIVQKTLQSKYFTKAMDIIDPIIGEQLEVFYRGGVYGLPGGGANFVPEYASKSM